MVETADAPERLNSQALRECAKTVIFIMPAVKGKHATVSHPAHAGEKHGCNEKKDYEVKIYEPAAGNSGRKSVVQKNRAEKPERSAPIQTEEHFRPEREKGTEKQKGKNAQQKC